MHRHDHDTRTHALIAVASSFLEELYNTSEIIQSIDVYMICIIKV